jgi:enoyl-CoA hydratase
MPTLIVRKDAGIGRIVISNPDKHNAMTYSMLLDLPLQIEALEKDPEVRVIVLTGDGERSFVSGADISELNDNETAEAQQKMTEAMEAACAAPVRCSKAVVARIRGICMGAGLGLAASCDVRICSGDAVFRMPAAGIGIGYPYSGVRRFVDLIGPGNTAEIFFGARKFGADEALRRGFVQQVFVSEFEREADLYCAAMAENAPLTVSAAKQAIAQALLDPHHRDLHAMQQAIDACYASDDYAEGRRAFAEKRKPKFLGR